MEGKSQVLKLALFATGLSGIVAEYTLSTLASYFLGNSILQWTMIVSIMLFSMGLGSRWSRHIQGNLLTKFIAIELALSLLVSFSSLITYTVAGYSAYLGLIIYALSILIGVLIGLEIPLVIRLNEEFENLRVNIASVLEKDYWGSLVGGLFFAFLGLPYLGLTYTPFILGGINLMVALLLFFSMRKSLWSRKRFIVIAGSFTVVCIAVGSVFAEPIIFHGEQQRYRDKVIYSQQSKYQKIVITEWKNDYWLYLNGNQQLSTVDEDKYHEPLVHPAMQLAVHPTSVLVLGGGDGCAIREILKYNSVERIVLVDLDPQMTEIAKEHPVMRSINEGALSSPLVEVLNQDGFKYLEATKRIFDVIIIDLPDPKSVDLNRLYTREFYSLCSKQLSKDGIVVTQAGSPYFATNAFVCIDRTMESAGFGTLPLHNHVITLGEWGWVVGSKRFNQTQLKRQTLTKDFDGIKTKWINKEAMRMMVSFGKNIYVEEMEEIEINTIHNPVLYHYYLKGNWDLY